MISEETLEELKCAISDEEHFFIEPIPLTNCGHSICRTCIPNDDLIEIKCKICGLVSKHDFNKFQASKSSQKLLRIYLEDIFKILEAETSLKLNDLKENIKNKKEFLEVNFKYIREEIGKRVESLVNQVQEMGNGLVEKVKEKEKEALNSITRETQISDINLSLNELNENIKKKINLNKDYLQRFQNKMKGLNILIDEINEYKIADYKISTQIIDEENLIGHFKANEYKFKTQKEITFDHESQIYRMTLVESKKKLLINDYNKTLLHLLDLDENIFKSFNPNNVLKCPLGVCVLSDLIDEKIFIGDMIHKKIFVFNSDFDLKFQFGDKNLKYPSYMQIDNEFDKSRLYVSDSKNNEITIWNTKNGSFIAKIDIETPKQTHFTQNSLFVSSPILEHQMKINKVIKITRGGNCIFEVDKVSLEIKRRIIGNWYAPELLNIEPNGNLQIVAWDYNNNITISDMICLLTIDLNGKIIEKVELNGIDGIYDVLLADNKIMATVGHKLKMFM